TILCVFCFLCILLEGLHRTIHYDHLDPNSLRGHAGHRQDPMVGTISTRAGGNGPTDSAHDSNRRLPHVMSSRAAAGWVFDSPRATMLTECNAPSCTLIPPAGLSTISS